MNKKSAEAKKEWCGTKKMPTLFKRVFDDSGGFYITDEVTEGCEWVLNGEGEATEKVDGAACAVIDGNLYKRFDAKRGKEPPKNAIPCIPAPDPITGHWPHWVLVDAAKSSDRWFVRAWINTPWIGEMQDPRTQGTYEAVGLHFQSNPYGLDDDFLERHGRIKIKDRELCCDKITGARSFESIKEYLRTHEIEGIVFWKDGEPRCKIKRSDFGFKWPVRWE